MDVDRPDVLDLEAEETSSTNQVEENVDLHVPRVRAPLVPQTGAIGPSPRVRRLLLTDKKISDLNNSRGPTGIGLDGKPLGTISRDYDIAFLRELVLRGISNAEELCEALKNRGDDAALFRGEKYIQETVESVIRHVGNVVDESEVDFSVTAVRVFECSERPFYELEIDGKVLDLSSRDILIRGRFRRRFLEVLGRVPVLPESDDGWCRFVDALLAGAIRIDLGSSSLREEITEIIAALPIASSPHRMTSGDAVLVDENRRAFKLPALLSRLARRKLRPSPEKVAAILQSLGFEYARPRISGRQVRAWVSPPDRDM